MIPELPQYPDPSPIQHQARRVFEERIKTFDEFERKRAEEAKKPYPSYPMNALDAISSIYQVMEPLLKDRNKLLKQLNEVNQLVERDRAALVHVFDKKRSEQLLNDAAKLSERAIPYQEEVQADIDSIYRDRQFAPLREKILNFLETVKSHRQAVWDAALAASLGTAGKLISQIPSQAFVLVANADGQLEYIRREDHLERAPTEEGEERLSRVGAHVGRTDTRHQG